MRAQLVGICEFKSCAELKVFMFAKLNKVTACNNVPLQLTNIRKKMKPIKKHTGR